MRRHVRTIDLVRAIVTVTTLAFLAAASPANAEAATRILG